MADSPLPLFIDTNLGTHFAMGVPPDVTVADLKEKIRTNHALCFPDFGEVSVQAMKVRRKGSFYHLLDSMPVKCSFAGIKGAWFLHLDLLSVTSIKKVQTEAARSILDESCPKRLCITQTECNTIPSPQNNEVENQGFVMNDLLADKGRISSESPTAHEGQTLPDTLLANLATQGDSSFPDTANCQSLKLQSSDQLVSGDKDGAEVHLHVQGNDLNDNRVAVTLSEHDKRTNPTPMEVEEPVNGGNAVVGFHFQRGKELIIDQVKKDEREEDHPVVAANVTGASPIASKKAKSRKKGCTVQNNQVLEDQFQHPSAEHKKRKKRKDGSLEEAGKDQVTGHNFDTGAHSKRTSDLETSLPKTSPQGKHENQMASSDALPSKSSHVDSLKLNPVEDGPKKKKKKRLSRLFDESQQNRLADPLAENKVAHVGKQNQAAEGNDEDDLVKKIPDLARQTDAADIISKGSEKEIDGSNVEVGRTEPSYTTHTGSDYNKEILSGSIITSKQFPIQEVTSVDKEGLLDWNSVGLNRESSGAVIPKEVEHAGNHSEVDYGLPADSHSNRKKRKSEKHASSKSGSFVEHVNIESVEEVPGNKYNNLSREPDPATVAEDLVNANPSNIGSGVFTNVDAGSSRQDRRKKGDKTESPNPLTNTSETVDASVGRASLDEPKETSGEHIRRTGKESDGDSLVTSGIIDSILTSKPNDKKPKLSKKKLGKTKLPEPTVPETDRSLAEDGENSKEPVKDIANGMSAGDHGQLDIESKIAALSGEVAANVISATVDSIVTSKPNDKKPKSSKRKKGKSELPGPIVHEVFHSVAKEHDGNNIKEPLKDISMGTSGSDHGHLEKDPKVAALSGEANVMPATVDSTVQNSKDKKLKRSRKKSGKAELLKPLISEATPALKDDAKEDLKETAGDIFSGASGGNFGHPGKESKGTTIAGEDVADLDSTIVVSTALSHPDDKKSKQKKKRPEKSGLLNQEFTKEGNKIMEEKRKETLAGNNKGLGQESKLATIPTKATPCEHTTELDPVVSLNTKLKNLRQDKKKTKKPINNEHTHVNLEKEVGTTNVRPASAFNAGINSDDTTQHLDNTEHSNIIPAESVNEISDKHKAAQLSAEKVAERITMHLSGKTLEESGKATDHDMNLQKSVELTEANDSMGLTKSDGDKIKFIDYFTPQVTQTVPVHAQNPPARNIETKKNKEITIRKRKPFLPPLDQPSNDLLSPSVSDELHETSNADLVDPLGHLTSEEHKINETPKRKTVKKTRKSDIHSRNTSSVLASPSKLLGDRAANKHQESSSHPRLSASMDEKNIHKKSKISIAGTESQLQPPAGNESIDAMVTTDEGSLSKNSDVIKSDHVGGSISQKHSSADAHAHALLKESSDNYSASSDSSGEASQLPGKYRVAVRKIPSKRYRKEANMSRQKEISLGTTATIFDGTSESSKDEFEINHRQTSLKAGLDNSSNSADSDGDLEETQTSSYKARAYINSPEDGSVAYDETNREGDGERNTMPRSSSTRKKVRPLNMILKRTNIFQNAMRNASQSEVDDSETQPVDFVLETQPE